MIRFAHEMLGLATRELRDVGEAAEKPRSRSSCFFLSGLRALGATETVDAGDARQTLAVTRGQADTLEQAQDAEGDRAKTDGRGDERSQGQERDSECGSHLIPSRYYGAANGGAYTVTSDTNSLTIRRQTFLLYFYVGFYVLQTLRTVV